MSIISISISPHYPLSVSSPRHPQQHQHHQQHLHQHHQHHSLTTLYPTTHYPLSVSSHQHQHHHQHHKYKNIAEQSYITTDRNWIRGCNIGQVVSADLHPFYSTGSISSTKIYFKKVILWSCCMLCRPNRISYTVIGSIAFLAALSTWGWTCSTIGLCVEL